MFDALRPGPALACLSAALGLAGCMTPHAKPHLSQAVVEARARHREPPPPACPQTEAAAAQPVRIDFGFNSDELDVLSGRPLAEAARWLTCHAAAPVVIRPEADGHGKPAEQDDLAARRAEVVSSYLSAHGVAADRIRVLPRGQAAPGGEVFVIDAEGRRW